MPLALIALGGNQPESRESISLAAEILGQQCGTVESISSVRMTPAMGRDAGAEFANAALSLRTDLPAEQLLQDLHEVEAACGRKRVIRWGPRILDLDLLLYDQLIIDLPRIVIPHPFMWFRSFVLDPLAEIVPDVMHPLTRCNVQSLQRRISTRPISFEWENEMGDRPSGLSELTTEVRRQSGQSGLMIHPVAGSAESVTAGIARLRISRPSCDEQRTQPRHAPPFVIDIASEDPSNAVGDDTVIEQICDVVTAIAG